jgi:hypothetical protein
MGRQDAVYLSHSTGFGKATDKETAWQAAKFSESKSLQCRIDRDFVGFSDAKNPCTPKRLLVGQDV